VGSNGPCAVGRISAISAFYIDAATVPLGRERPLLIVDADEVLLRFVQGLDRFLATRGLYLDLSSYRLYGNIRHRNDDAAVIDVEVAALLDEFRGDLDSLEPVEGAREALMALSPHLDVVALSNVTPSQAPSRLRNFAAHGFSLPLVVNSGPKGPAVKTLARRAGPPVFFVDDIPQHLASVAEAAPEVFRIHLIGDDRLKPLLPAAPHAHLRADTWPQAEAFIREKLALGT
jgi:hypothetical protein